MNVLITGHRGYIGVEMVPALRALGHDVVGLDIGLYDECDFRAPPDEVPWLKVDLRDVTPRHLRGFDAVVHLAALSNDPLGDLDRELTFGINRDASVRLAKAAKEAGVRRFLFSSSCSLYGAGEDGLLDENAAFHPVTPYGESKVLVEKDLSRLASGSFSPVYLRNATAYGVSRRLRADVVVNNLVGSAVTTGQVLLQSDGSAWRPLVHLQDIIHAFAVCLVAPLDAVHDQAFNVGLTSQNFRMRQVAELVAEVVPDCTVAFAPGASPDKRNYRVDFGKIVTKLPGYRPRWTLRDGIEELYRAYRAAALTKAVFSGPRYYRLRTVRGLQDRGVLDAQLRPRAASPVRVPA
jgi:nucleoside-diphosphate-sugar epimerase